MTALSKRAAVALGAALGATALALACGGSTAGTGDPKKGDAGAADRQIVEEIPDASPTIFDTDVPLGRCPGSTYTQAPSGAACDPKRIQRAGSFEPACYGPTVGVLCDRLIVGVQAADEALLPAGFVCGSPELGVKTCAWSFGGDAAQHALDDAALEAACAVTAAIASAIVTCATHGS